MRKIVKGIGTGVIIAGIVYAFGIVGSRDRGLIEFSELVTEVFHAMLICGLGAAFVMASKFNYKKFKEGIKK